MPRYILFIRRPGRDDHAETHHTEQTAVSALVDQVRKDWPDDRSWPRDDEAIALWAREAEATHAIVRIAPTEH